MSSRATILLVVCLIIQPLLRGEDQVAVNADSATAYIRSCRKANGAFGPADQEYTDAAWNFPAVAALGLLGADIDQPQAILQHGLGYPNGAVGVGHWQFHHYHGLRQLLHSPMSAQTQRVRLQHQGWEVRYYGSPFGTNPTTLFRAGGGSEPDPRDVSASELGYYNLSSLYYLLSGLAGSGRSADNADELVAFVQRRQAPSGGFVDIRTETGEPRDADAHVAHTFHALAALKMLGARPPNPAACTRFLQSSQRPDGAFGWNPDRNLAGNHPDVYYLWAAVRALALLEAKPTGEKACLAWLNSLQNSDGGFGDRTGWRSRLYSTYYANDALGTLTGNARAAITEKRIAVRATPSISEGRYQIYQGLNKVPVIEPQDLAGLRERGFNLLALKSADFALAGRLRESIRENRLPMDVILCPEAYPHRTEIPGGALLDHVANVTLDPGWSQGERDQWAALDALGKRKLPWRDYENQFISPVRELGALIYPEQDYEIEHAYRAYDDGALGRNGYNAMLAGFNWAPRDFVRVFPWRERYVTLLTPIADADAHGDLAKWSPQLDHTRHLFIAEGPSYADFQKAAADGRVVCAILSAEETGPEVTLYGPPAAVAYCKRHQREWQWWKERTAR